MFQRIGGLPTSKIVSSNLVIDLSFAENLPTQTHSFFDVSCLSAAGIDFQGNPITR